MEEKNWEPALAEFQEENCRGCRFADEEKVGTGHACCTHMEGPKVKVDPTAKHGRCVRNKKTSENQEVPHG
jgi:hypothetical protein